MNISTEFYSNRTIDTISCAKNICMNTCLVTKGISACGFLSARECVLQDVKCANLTLQSTLIQNILCHQAEINRSAVVGNIRAENSVCLKDNSEAISIFADHDILIQNSKVKGSAFSRTDCIVVDSSIKSVVANHNVALKNSYIEERVMAYGSVIECFNSTVDGTLICSNQCLSVVNCKIKTLLLTQLNKQQRVCLENSQIENIHFHGLKGLITPEDHSQITNIFNGVIVN